MGFVLESPTWRANPDWGAKLGYGREALAKANRAAVELMREVRDAYAGERTPIAIRGCIGPRGDGCDPGKMMSADEAQAYHAWQVGVLRDSGADFVSGFTIEIGAFVQEHDSRYARAARRILCYDFSCVGDDP